MLPAALFGTAAGGRHGFIDNQSLKSYNILYGYPCIGCRLPGVQGFCRN